MTPPDQIRAFQPGSNYLNTTTEDPNHAHPLDKINPGHRKDTTAHVMVLLGINRHHATRIVDRLAALTHLHRMHPIDIMHRLQPPTDAHTRTAPTTIPH
jgi:hypothetical protein